MDQIELDAERKLVDNFLREVMQAYPKATYGEMMVRSALERGAIDRLLVSEGLRKNTVELRCGSCQHEWTTTIARMEPIPPCPSCNAAGDNAKELSSISLIEELGKMAVRSNTEIIYISVDTLLFCSPLLFPLLDSNNSHVCLFLFHNRGRRRW